VIGGLRFYERQEIRDAIAYLRVTVQPDDDLAFQRIINVPKRGIGDATVQTLSRYARAQNLSLFGALRRLLETDEFKPKVKQTLTALVADFDRWHQLWGNWQGSSLTKAAIPACGRPTNRRKRWEGSRT